MVQGAGGMTVQGSTPTWTEPITYLLDERERERPRERERLRWFWSPVPASCMAASASWAVHLYACLQLSACCRSRLQASELTVARHVGLRRGEAKAHLVTRALGIHRCGDALNTQGPGRQRLKQQPGAVHPSARCPAAGLWPGQPAPAPWRPGRPWTLPWLQTPFWTAAWRQSQTVSCTAGLPTAEGRESVSPMQVKLHAACHPRTAHRAGHHRAPDRRLQAPRPGSPLASPQPRPHPSPHLCAPPLLLCQLRGALRVGHGAGTCSRCRWCSSLRRGRAPLASDLRLCKSAGKAALLCPGRLG